MLRFKLFLFLFTSASSFAQDSLQVIPFASKSFDQFLNVRDFCISKNESEAYFTVQTPDGKLSQLYRLRKAGSDWQPAELLPFCDANNYLEPFLSEDGLRLYFASDKPVKGEKQTVKNFDLWYVERKAETKEWSEPVNLGKSINSEVDEFFPAVSKNNHLYFTKVAPTGKGKDDIYCCFWDGQKYAAPVLLDDNINSAGYEFNAFISSNEKLLIFTKYGVEGDFGSGDLYIARKDENGVWQKAQNMGPEINTKYMEYCPFYDEQRQILYFTSKRNKTGFSRIYQVKIAL